MKTTKTIPTFKDENQEREFWENNDTLDYFDTSKVKMVRFPNLKKSIDFPFWMIKSLDKEAKHVGVSRQAVIKMWLAERLQELNSKVATI